MVDTLTPSFSKSSAAGTISEQDLFKSNWPLGYAGGDTSLYRYVGNNPVNETDARGLQAASGAEQPGKSCPPTPSRWENFKDWFWTLIGYGEVPNVVTGVAGGAQVVGEMMQANNVEKYLENARNHYEKGTPEWKDYNRRLENVKKMRADAAKNQCK